MGTFHLTRYFSTLSFVLIVLSGGVLDTFFAPARCQPSSIAWLKTATWR